MRESSRQDPDPEMSPFLEGLLASSADPSPTSCLDVNAIASLVSGDLLSTERARLEEHLVSCVTCRDRVAELVREVPENQEPNLVGGGVASTGTPRPRTIDRFRIPLALAASLLLLAVGFALFNTGMLRRWFGGSLGTIEERLFASGHELRRDLPELFGSFVPLTKEERRSPLSDRDRGTFSLRSPVHRLLDERPTFVWGEASAASSYEVHLFSADGAPVWKETATGSSLSLPPEEPPLSAGKQYLWFVVARFESREESTSSLSFEIASRDEASRFEEQLQRIDSECSAEVRDLLKAHLAIRSQLFSEAVRYARAFRDDHPEESIGLETLYHVLESLNNPEAETLRVGFGD